eukprot:scaffold705_cov74-Cylindrotheca_fusiformis.AAC.3
MNNVPLMSATACCRSFLIAIVEQLVLDEEQDNNDLLIADDEQPQGHEEAGLLVQRSRGP